MFLKSDYQLMIDNELKLARTMLDKASGAHEEASGCSSVVWAESYYRAEDDYRAKAKRHLLEAEYWKTYLKEDADCVQV